MTGKSCLGDRDVVRVLIVDDSATARLSLKIALESDPTIRVVGEVADGDEVLRQVRRLAPDLVTMDVYLAKLNGLDIAADLMREQAVPILVVTAANPTNPEIVYRAMAAGVLDVCAKLPAPSASNYEARRREIIRVVRALARVPVVRRRFTVHPANHPAAIRESLFPRRNCRLLLLGASTGGPKIICDLLCALPPLSTPVVIAQHITHGFAPGLVDWLRSETRREVLMINDLQQARANVIYLPMEGRHAEVRHGGILASVDLAGEDFSPSIDHLFESAARACGAGAMAVLMTGMGRDGATGLLALRRAGAVTIAQQPATCVVDSMPKTAIELGAAQFVLPPQGIVDMLGARFGTYTR